MASFPVQRTVATLSGMSSGLLIPVEMMIGLPVAAARPMSAKSFASNGRNLVGRRVKGRQKVHGRFIEWGGE